MYLFDGYSSINDNDPNLEWVYLPSGLGRNVENTKVEWFLKWFTFDNDNTIDIKLAWILKKYQIENDSDTELEWTLKRYRVDNDDSNSDDDTFHEAVRGMQQIDDLVYYDSNINNDNKDNGDTFRDATKIEDAIEDTYDDDTNAHGKPINSNSDDGNENDDDTFHDAIQVEDTELDWNLKKYRVDNIKFDQKKELKRWNYTDTNKEDQPA